MAGGEIVGALHDLSTCPGTAPRASLAARGADSHRSLSRHRPADRAGFEAVRRASWPSRGRSSSASSAWTWPRQPSSWVTSRAAAGNSGWRSSQPPQSCWTCHAFALGGTVDPLACRRSWQSQRERTARSRRGAACRRAVGRRFPTGPAARQAPGCAPRADHRVDAGLASGAGGLDVQPVGILAADHPDEGAFAGEPLGPVPGGGIGQVEGAPVGVAAASTARRERAGQSDKRFRMPRSPGRVPPRCTARVPRNSARLEHLTRFDRRREAEQGDRLPPRSPDGRPLAGRRTKPQAGRVGLHHQLPPDRYLNSIPSPEIEATVAGEGEHPSPPRKRRRRPSTSPSRPPSLRSPKHRVCVVTTQGSDAWSSRRSVPMVGSATFPTADRTPSRVGAQVGDGCRGAVAGRGAHCYGKACSPGSSLVRLGSRAWPRLTCSRPDAPRPMSEVASPASPASSQRSVLDLATAARHPVSAVLQELGSTQTGLTSEEAAGRLASVGRNVLASHKVTALGVLGRQLRNPLLILLLAAAAVSAATGDPTDGAIIAAIVGLSVGLGFVNEYRSELAVAALHAGIRHQALVWRDGSQQRLDVRDLVPGDVVALRVGDLVPADLRLLEADQLECDEAVLTGEPIPAVKTADPVLASDSTVDLPSCAFMGTVVHQGAGR